MHTLTLVMSKNNWFNLVFSAEITAENVRFWLLLSTILNRYLLKMKQLGLKCFLESISFRNVCHISGLFVGSNQLRN